ncbi:MAG: ester cyclase [Holophagae bacterium]
MRMTTGIVCFCAILAATGCCQDADLTESNKEVVRAVVRAMNEGRVDDLDLYIAQTYHRHCRATPDAVVETLDDFKNLMKTYEGAFPDGRVEIYELIAEGDMVAVTGTYRGTHTAPMGPCPATGRLVDSEFAGYHRLENGKIVETWVTWDNLAMFHQLGLDPPVAGTVEPGEPEQESG